MKYLKYLLYLVLVLVVLFFGMGIFTPSVTYTNEVTTNKPIEEAWAVMSDDSKVSDWLPVITKMELVSGTANSVGAVSHIYVVENGEEMVMEETITDLIVNERIAMTFTMDFMNMDYEMELKEKDGKTVIQSTSTTTGNGIFAKSIIAFMPQIMQEQEEKNLNRLKEVIEGNTTNYFSTPAPDSVNH